MKRGIFKGEQAGLRKEPKGFAQSSYPGDPFFTAA